MQHLFHHVDGQFVKISWETKRIGHPMAALDQNLLGIGRLRHPNPLYRRLHRPVVYHWIIKPVRNVINMLQVVAI